MKTAIFFISIFACFAFAAGLSTEQFSESGITLDFSTSAPVFESVTLLGTGFTQVTVEGADNLAEAGFPALPVYRTWIEIPIGAEVVSTVSNAVIETIPYHGAAVIPAVKSTTKDNSPNAFTVYFDTDTYSNGITYPSNWIRIIYAGGVRGRNLAMVEVTPVRWTAGADSFTLLSSADITLEFQGGDIAASYEQATRLGCSEYEMILRNTVSNYGIFEGGVDSTNPKFLIIGHKNFLSSGMDAFVRHKESLGFDVTMVDLSVTGSTYDSIRRYIHTSINSGTVYVLLVGDTAFLPSGPAVEYEGVTDLYYACLDDGGWIPDVLLGRFSVETLEQATVMAQKVIDYENSTGVQGWVQNALFIASEDNSDITEAVHNKSITEYFDRFGYNSIKMYPNSGGNTRKTISRVNTGLSLIVFSGHGVAYTWADMYFNPQKFVNFKNKDMYPGILSHCCQTGDFDFRKASWGEIWTRTADKGGLWFWGCVPSSLWDEDNVLQMGEFESFFGGVHKTKLFLNQGLMAVYQKYSGGGETHYYYEGYNLLGDPSVTLKSWPITDIEDSRENPICTVISAVVPNPVYGDASVILTGVSGMATLEIFDVAGRMIDKPFHENLSGTAVFTWDATSIDTGVYFLRLTQNGNVVTSRVSVIR